MNDWHGSDADRSRVSEADVVVIGPNGVRTADWPTIVGDAANVGNLLRSKGLTAGGTTILSGETSYSTLVGILGAWMCGASVGLTVPGEGDDGLAGRRVVILDDRSIRRALVGSVVATDRQVTSVLDLLRHGLPADALAVLQATSGTTGGRRLVPVTWSMLRENTTAIAARLGLDDHDSFVSWMPLFHDMGLVAYVVLPLLLGARCTLVSPRTFAGDPTSLLAAVTAREGSMVGCTTTAVAMIERALARAEPHDLTSLRHLVWGAEMVDVDLCERTLRAGERHRLRPDAFAFAYGLAEGTLAVSIKPHASPADATVTEPSSTSPAGFGWRRPLGRGFARTGSPVGGTEVRYVDVETRRPRRDGEVGEIEIRGPSVMRAYLGASPEESGIAADGWLATGDLGCDVAGEVVVVGRMKDVVVVGGRNLAPEEVERVVGALPGIRAGRVAAVPIVGPAGEALAIVAERKPGGSVDERAVRSAVRRAMGVSPLRVTFVPPGTVPKTTSGKIRRTACRDLVSHAG